VKNSTSVGTVTLLFSDIEGSTRLLQSLGEAYGDLLSRHHDVIRGAVAEANGRVIDTAGDGFFVAFDRARDAIAAAVSAQRAIAQTSFPASVPVRVRMGIHTGEPSVSLEGYIGLDVHRAARICSAAVGGQVLLSNVSVDLARGDLPDGVELQDLGTHRLKDLYEPEHLFQLAINGLRSDFPPPRTLEAKRFNFPVPPTRLIGREYHVAAVCRILQAGTARLVTLTGPGGTGKTRLSLAVADVAADRFDDGAAFVGLATLTDPGLVPATIAHALGLHESAARPTFDVLIEHLQEREMLLVLDNFEQIVDGASVVAALLAACPCVSALVTSRIVLRLRGEHEFPVPTLDLPDLGAPKIPDTLRVSPAVMLFVERARAVRPDFDLDADNASAVAELCARLDGLPLALELAAARIRLFSPQALLARLGGRLDLLQGGARDLPERHQTLRAAIGWSYELLSAAEQTLFRRLAVFMGGFSLEAAEAICRGIAGGMDVLEGLSGLVERSLVRRESDVSGEPRFGLLETVRAFGIAALEAAGEADSTREAHAHVMLDLATTAAPDLTGPDQQRWLEHLAADHDNLRAAGEWFARHDGEAALRLCAALYRFWIVRGHLREGRRTSEAVLTLPGAPARSSARARVAFGLATFHHETGDFRGSHRLMEESLGIALELGDDARIAEASNGLAWVLAMVGRTEESRLRAEVALTLNRRLGDRRGEAISLHNLALISFWSGDPQQARSHYARAIPIMAELGERRGVAYFYVNLSWVDLFQGRLDDAASRLDEALITLAVLRDSQLMAWALGHQGVLAVARGEAQRAIRTFDESISLWREVGNRFGIGWTLGQLASALVEVGLVDRAGTVLREAEAIWADTGSRRGMAMMNGARLRYVNVTNNDDARRRLLEGVHVAAEIRDVPVLLDTLEVALPLLIRTLPAERGASLVGLADAACERTQRLLTPLHQTARVTIERTLREALGDDAFEHARRTGAGSALDDAARAIEAALQH
jgi:predicted ATPase/class 3 adenylate cyclase